MSSIKTEKNEINSKITENNKFRKEKKEKINGFYHVNMILFSNK